MTNQLHRRTAFSLQAPSPLRLAILTGVVIFLSACFPLLYLWNHSSKALNKELQSALRDTARSAALLVNADLHSSFTNRSMEASEAYQEEVAKLRSFMEKNSRLAYVYTTILKDGIVHFVLDAALPGDADGDGVDDHSYIMDVYKSPSPQLVRALREGVSTVDHEPYQDQWGAFISGYAILRDSNGSVVGALGADMTVGEMVESLSVIRRSALVGIGIASLIALGTGFFVWRLRTRALTSQDIYMTASRERDQATLHYHQVLEQVPIGVMNYDTRLILRDCNESFINIVRGDRVALLGFDLNHLTDRRLLPLLQDSLRGKTGHYSGPYHMTGSNIELWVDILCGPLRDPDGHIIGGIATVEDISPRHQSDILSEAEKKILRMIAQEAPLHDTLLLLVQTIERLLPESLCSILFLDKDGQRLTKGVAPNLPTAYNEAVEGAIIGPEAGSCGSAVYTGHMVIAADIATHPFWRNYKDLALAHNLRACWSLPIRSRHGKIMGTFAIYFRTVKEPSSNDLAQLEHAGYLAGIAIDRSHFEQELSQERYLLRSLIDNIPDIIFIKDRQFRYLAANRAATEFLGVDNEDALLGKTDQELFATRVTKDQHLVEERVLLQATPHHHETSFIKPDGQVIFLSASCMPLTNHNNDIIGLIMIGRDITDHHRIQEERIKTQKLESLSLLAGGLAHDFNNILTSILGNIVMTQASSPVNDEGRELLREAEIATLRARDLAQQLLTFAKGGLPIKKLTAVNDVIREAATLAVRGSASRLAFDLPTSLWIAEIDVGQISQVVQNLTINADQAMPNGGTIDISSRNINLNDPNTFGLPAGHYIQVSIADHGTGIPPNALVKVFDPYFTTKPSGSGLGLSTSFSIIKKHGGHIFAASEPGQGATFTFLIPALSDNVPVHTDHPAHVQPQTKSARILIMDDEEAILKLSKKVLEKAGYTVHAAHEGCEALALFREARESGTPFDLIILDLTIPGGMGGKETLDEMKKLDPMVRVIVSSGYSVEDIMSRHESFGFHSVVTKPYLPADLIKAIHDALSDESFRV